MLYIGPRILALAVGVALSSGPATAADYANAHLLVDAPALETRIIENGRKPVSEANLRIIDVRPEAAYRAGHIPGAVSIPFTDLTDPQAHIAGALKSTTALASLLGAQGLDASREIVIYDDQGGFRAARLFWVLEWFGHRDVKLLDGGLPGWQSAGLPLRRSPDIAQAAGSDMDGHGTEFAVNLTPRRYASADWILERRSDRDTVVIDVRPPHLYDAGHIPWAQSLPWKDNLKADGTMKAAPELAAHFAQAGVLPQDNIVIHCQTGEASAHSYFALRLLGYPQVRVYHRSWAEWGAADDLPKAVSAKG